MNSLRGGVLALVVSGCAEAAGDHCYRSAVGNKPVPWPKHPLTFDDLKNTIMNGSNVSRNYYEIYDRSPAPPLPILRKVVINWKFNSSGYINDYAGYSNLRMSIYSHYGPNGLPWGAIAKDLCKNGSPPMEDPRWILTHDAPTQCSFANSRRRRDIGLV
ncbi:hypothetical protein MAR_031926 [Mya arenaria]|uniref:Uncharacterized protein n=1 Tax=Mya arenaria TaxID=6604 RepID=A0ABY7F575_MYAAR|nr:hypothetical protein MAR_031926 [Mya arenaria]